MYHKLNNHERALRVIIEESNGILENFPGDSHVIKIREIAEQALSKQVFRENRRPIKYNFTVEEDSRYTFDSHKGAIYATSESEAEEEVREKYAEKLGAFKSSLEIHIKRDGDWSTSKKDKD